MQRLYTRIFNTLDSSIAEDWQTRHVFEDILKLADHGVLDMTRQAFARRTNIPMEIVNDAIGKLEAPDPNSRDEAEAGARIVRLDHHRDWGWRIVNWDKYESIHNQAENRAKTLARVKAHREKCRTQEETSPTPPKEEEIGEVQVYVEGALQNRYTPLQSVTATKEGDQTSSEDKHTEGLPLFSGEPDKSNTKRKRKDKPVRRMFSIEEVTASMLRAGGTEVDARIMFDHHMQCPETAWTTKRGPITDLDAATRGWMARGRGFASPNRFQKSRTADHPGTQNHDENAKF